MQTVLFL